MSLREQYTAEEWQTLQFGPLWVFTTVVSGQDTGDEKRLEALAREIQEAPLYRDPLVREVLVSVGDELSDLMVRYQEDARNVMDGLQDVAQVLGQKAGDEGAENFKKSMLLIGGNVAKAGDETGAEAIGDEEKRALGLITEWLDLHM